MRFNSTLVRFKPAALLPMAVARFRFNSTLVRFKLNCANRSFVEDAVSIPLWFDSNRELLLRQLEGEWFQFHSGSIQTTAPEK